MTTYHRRGTRGYALMTGAACAIGMIAMLGLSVDLGRMHIARNEAQAYVDASAMSAARKLDGTAAGLQDARDAVATNLNRWHLGTTAFQGTVTEFATAPGGPWNPNPAPANVTYVRVRAVTTPPLYFIPIVNGLSEARVSARAVAGQVLKTGPYKEGVFPFSPMAHDESDPINFGLVPGEVYTLRWAAAPRLHHNNVCDGDDVREVIEKAEATGEERGYIEDTSASAIRESIEGDRQSIMRDVGDTVAMTGGAKQTQQDAIVNRVRQDTDSISTSYAEYVASGTGNGRRLVLVPVNTWSPNYRIVGFRGFFLLESSLYQAANGGNKPFCAEYVGNFTMGTDHKGAGGAGSYIVRLVE